jgi:hypothetical protein
MQEMILVQQEAHGETREQASIESLRSDVSILSITVINTGDAVDREMSNHRQRIASVTDDEFHVTDLFSSIDYIVTSWKKFRQLSFMVGQHQIRATLQPDADIVEVASVIGSRIETIVSSN